MNGFEISKPRLLEMMYETVVRAAMDLPGDVEGALHKALADETTPLARLHLETTLGNVKCAREEQRLACADTGFPLYYVVVGDNVQIEGGGCPWPQLG